MKLARYRVTELALSQLLKPEPPGVFRYVQEGPPLSAEFAYSYLDPDGRTIWLVYRDNDFPALAIGEPIPERPLVVSSTRLDIRQPMWESPWTLWTH